MNFQKIRFPRKLITVTRTASILSIVLLVTGCPFFPPAANVSNGKDGSPPISIPKPQIDIRKPLEASADAQDLERCKNIQSTIDHSRVSNARWGLIMIELGKSKIVCEKNSRELFNPASIQKLVTSAVGLEKLGNEHRFKTSIYSKKQITKGVLTGDLILYGRGAPDLDDRSIAALVRQLRQKGLRRVSGDIIGDQSYFKGDGLGDGWTWNSVQWYYGAAASALSVNQNRLTISIKDGKPVSSSRYARISGDLSPVEDIEAVGVKRELGTNNVFVWGSGRSLNARIAVSNPALYAAGILKDELQKNGIRVSGSAKSVDWKADKTTDLSASVELASVESRSLADIIGTMNRESVNLSAELILRLLGRKFGNEAPDDNPKLQKLRGDDSAGASVVKKWLKEKRLADDRIAIHDGSGLSRLDLITPETLGRLLLYTAQSKYADTFKNSLAVAGVNGTMRGRLKSSNGKVLAKTGSITYVESLAGYAQTEKETFAFVVMVNNQTSKSDASSTIDEIVGLLVRE